MKILFISPRTFGQMGTPGTYLVTEAYARYSDLMVIANKNQEESIEIVHTKSNSLNLLEVDFSDEQYLEEITIIARKFRPELIIVASHPKWYSVVDYLKEK